LVVWVPLDGLSAAERSMPHAVTLGSGRQDAPRANRALKGLDHAKSEVGRAG
jgi:hypothetical protein